MISYLLLGILIILSIINILAFIQNKKAKENITKIDNSIIEKNHKAELELNEKTKELEDIYDLCTKANLQKVDYLKEVDLAKQQIENKQSELDRLQEIEKNQESLSRQAFENYCSLLDKEYNLKENEHNEDIERLKDIFFKLQSELMNDYENKQIDLNRFLDEQKQTIEKELEARREQAAAEKASINAELDKIRATKAAALQAQIREKEIKENKDFYRLDISEANKKDIRLLKSIQPDITNSVVIDKIIWSNYYQPLAKNKFPKIIGKETVCGIYKITNLITEESYIGQSTDCCERWKQHCKNGLGIGNALNENQLYKSMQKDGLYNFTFEILEECDKSLLDEKEKYYIELYDTYKYGLNGTRGNK